MPHPDAPKQKRRKKKKKKKKKIFFVLFSSHSPRPNSLRVPYLLPILPTLFHFVFPIFFPFSPPIHSNLHILPSFFSLPILPSHSLKLTYTPFSLFLPILPALIHSRTLLTPPFLFPLIDTRRAPHKTNYETINTFYLRFDELFIHKTNNNIRNF